MKKKILICIVLCCSFFLTACAGGVSNSKVSAEEEMIKAFYDAIYELNDEAKNDFDSSFENIVEKYDKPIKNLMEYEITEDTIYLEYIEQMQKNNFAIFINSQFFNKISKDEEENKIYRIMFGAPLEMATEEILSIELPFEYEKQIQLQSNTLSTKSARELVREYANDAIEQGYNVKYDMNRNAISYLELSEYTVNEDAFVLSPDIYVLDDEMGFALVFEHLDSDEVYSVKINEVEFNSTYIFAFGDDNDCFATVELEGIMSGMNEKKYQECFNVFDASDKITITLNSDFSFELTEYDVEQLRCYFAIYNNIKLLCK